MRLGSDVRLRLAHPASRSDDTEVSMKNNRLGDLKHRLFMDSLLEVLAL
jgi:hypothetical protein